ncbi:hypothetical protein, partial [Rothia endophytica]|uniref:hypothetical protein n=1 Tax=Rothia endophytica TaxID=1324766 RepID=UPI001F319347
DVAELLRQVCKGDRAVNPLTPSKCRNPLFEGADVIFPVDCPPATRLPSLWSRPASLKKPLDNL